MKRNRMAVLMLIVVLLLSGCISESQRKIELNEQDLSSVSVEAESDSVKEKNDHMNTESEVEEYYTEDSLIRDVMNDPVFGDYGRLIFPVDSGYMSGSTLGEMHLTWYNYIDPDKTVEICSFLRSHAENGDTIFYDIYSDEESLLKSGSMIRK